MMFPLAKFAVLKCIQTTFFGEVCDDCHGGAIFKIITPAVTFFAGLVVVLAVIGVIVAGILYATSSGNVAKQEKAKARFSQIAIGLAVFVFMNAILQFLLPGGLLNPTSGGECPEEPVLPDPPAGGGTGGSSGSGSSGGNPSSGGSGSNLPPGKNPDGSNYDVNGPVWDAGLKELKYSSMDYYLYVPENTRQGQQKPLLMFLHGSGEWGGKLSRLQKYGPVKYIAKEGKKYDFFFFEPHAGDNGFSSTKVWNALNSIVEEYSIDKSQIAIAGFSGGAQTAVGMVKDHQNTFSCALLIAQGKKGKEYVKYFDGLPTWVFYGTKDSKDLAAGKAFRKELTARNSLAKITAFDEGHMIVDLALSDNNVINWMLQQRKK